MSAVPSQHQIDFMAVNTDVDAKTYPSYFAAPQTLVSSNSTYMQNHCAHLQENLTGNSNLALGRICIATEPYEPRNYNWVGNNSPNLYHHLHQALPASSKFHHPQGLPTGVFARRGFGPSHMDLANNRRTPATLDEHDLWRMADYKSAERGVNFSSGDTDDWECSGLTDGDSGTSPSTSFNSWAALTPPPFLENAKDRAITQQYSADQHLIHTHVNSHAHVTADTMFMGNADTGGSSSYQLSSIGASLGHWYEDMYDSQSTALYGLVSAPSTYPSFALGPSEAVSHMNAYLPFDSKLTFADLAANNHYLLEEKPKLDHCGHVVPGLLSNTVLDSYSVTRSPTITPVTEDDGCSPELDVVMPPSAAPSHGRQKGSRSSTRRPSFRAPLTGAALGDRDSYLLQCRNKGLSYKEIKRRGGFEEAESTLRGRIRILSKPKHERVRKPHWHHTDVLLLREAVEEHATASSAGSATIARGGRRGYLLSKPPWKKVSEMMLKNGASYPFAPATCAKKWDQVQHMYRVTHQTG